jgi:hypothetical protein
MDVATAKSAAGVGTCGNIKVTAYLQMLRILRKDEITARLKKVGEPLEKKL